MAYQIVVGPECSAPAFSSSNVQMLYTTGSSTILSVAFQHEGMAEDIVVSQMFPQSATEAYWQVINTSETTASWWPIIVVDTGGVAASTEKGTVRVLETKRLTQKE
jgi:hypothetical protein